jgi:hypothetical protein
MEVIELDWSLEWIWRWSLKISETHVKKQQLYEVLVMKMKVIDKDSDCDAVVKQISSPIFSSL